MTFSTSPNFANDCTQFCSDNQRYFDLTYYLELIFIKILYNKGLTNLTSFVCPNERLYIKNVEWQNPKLLNPYIYNSNGSKKILLPFNYLLDKTSTPCGEVNKSINFSYYPVIRGDNFIDTNK